MPAQSSSKSPRKPFDMQVPQDQREGSQEDRKGLATFPFFSRFPREIQNQIWEKTFPQKRIFDNDTLRLLNPQNGIMYSYLTPYVLYVCHDSREFAQGRLSRSYLRHSWPQDHRRVIFFKPESGIYVCESTQLNWKPVDHYMFRYVKIIADVRPEDLSSNIRYGLRSVEFHEKFPKLQGLIVTDRHLNLYHKCFRYKWPEEEWEQVSRVFQDDWDRDAKDLEEFLRRKSIWIPRTSEKPKTDKEKKRYIESFPACKNSGTISVLDSSVTKVSAIFCLK
ncbi:hypothetical protein BKA64DRAFT_739204 [Cadophora sp. MPI-SDFR-AT-0126]|nr:hypothetical protein BKA64DRAFT_739204 [Leotiomycetes sp. MPI-SDFR-AT-0126]